MRTGVAIEFRVLGPLAAASDGRSLPLGAPKQRALLVELLLARGATVSRAALVDALWGSETPESAPGSLQVYVHGLRKAFGAGRIETHGHGYRLRLDPGELDLDLFEQLVASARDALTDDDPAAAARGLREALALWRGTALVDLAGHGPAVRAAELEELRLQALELHGEAELELGRHEPLLVELDRLVREHPYRERFREQQILALYRAGRQTEALEAYREVRRLLNDELGVEPGPALRELELAVLRHDPALVARAQPPPGEVRLPAPPTPLVGRRLEVAAVAALLRRRDVRLVTLTGEGGAGKTRVALAAAEELARELRGGAVFVDLAAVGDPSLLVAAIGQALRVDPGAGDPLEPVLAHLCAWPTLLVLDNLEQLLPAVEPIATLLAGAPRLDVLATSRAPLRLSGEHEYRVPSLPVPPLRASFEQTAENDAVRLFLARALAVDRTFALTDDNAGAVGAICRRLDGLPLALELAAAQTRLLSPDELERRLAQALDVLVGGARDLPPRQQTLRATLDWSWGLLADGERTALARLAVFAGGASLEAAEAVLGADALARISTLAAGGLVRRVESDPPRLELLETIREYALERLQAQGLEDATRRLHAAHFLALAERRRPELVGESIDAALAELDRERENLLAALAWSADAGEVETEVRLAVALQLYWKLRGNLAEGRRLHERAIADSSGKPALHARALFHGAVFAFRQGDPATARAEWERALGLFRELGDEVEAVRCIAELGASALATGELDRAEALYREAAGAFAAQGNRRREAGALLNLAAIAAERHDHLTAEAVGEACTALHRELADRDALAVGLHNLARAKQALGKPEQARSLAVEALEVAAQLGYREVIAYSLGTLGELALGAGECERAARLLGRSEAVFAELGLARYGEEAESFERALATLAARLDPGSLRELTDAGAALTREQAVAEALLTS